jgi:hypothetical protein
MVGDDPVIRPMGAWNDPANPLNRRLEGIAWANITAEEALMRRPLHTEDRTTCV